MERCPRCQRMTAEYSLYDHRIICYHRECGYQETNKELEQRTGRKKIECPDCGRKFYDRK